MIKLDIEPIPYQEFLTPFEGQFIRIILNFRQGQWLMSFKFNEKELNSLKLSSGVLMLAGQNLPFEIVIDDKGSGLDPFSIESFSNGFFDFLILDRSEISSIRGFEVE